jgi:hypothetical protein
MKTTIYLLMVILLTAMLCGCSTTNKSKAATTPDAAGVGSQVEEIMPGMLQGYLDTEQQLDSKAFVLPSPTEDSAIQLMDTAWADKMQALRGTARWDLAARDADLHFPAPADVFSCALGIVVNEEDTPALYMLLWRTMTDIGLAPYSAKNAYQRERPFMVRGETVCTPQDEEALRKDGSPSSQEAGLSVKAAMYATHTGTTMLWRDAWWVQPRLPGCTPKISSWLRWTRPAKISPGHARHNSRQRLTVHWKLRSSLRHLIELGRAIDTFMDRCLDSPTSKAFSTMRIILVEKD